MYSKRSLLSRYVRQQPHAKLSKERGEEGTRQTGLIKREALEKTVAPVAWLARIATPSRHFVAAGGTGNKTVSKAGSTKPSAVGQDRNFTMTPAAPTCTMILT
jgi:hypothetical protein